MKKVVKNIKREVRISNYYKAITGKFFAIGDCYKGRWWNAANLKEVRRLSKLALLLLIITSCSSVDTTSRDDSYWKQRCLAAEKVIEETIECWDSFYDTVAEGDSYSDWMELYEE